MALYTSMRIDMERYELVTVHMQCVCASSGSFYILLTTQRAISDKDRCDGSTIEKRSRAAHLNYRRVRTDLASEVGIGGYVDVADDVGQMTRIRSNKKECLHK